MKIPLYLLIALSVLPVQLMADELQLTNGDSLNGELVRTEREQFVWKSPVLGTLKVPKKHIKHKFRWLADISVFHNLQVLWNTSNSSDRILESTTGLRVPLTKRLSVAASVDHDRFNSRNNPEFQEDETEWNLKLGVSW